MAHMRLAFREAISRISDSAETIQFMTFRLFDCFRAQYGGYARQTT